MLKGLYYLIVISLVVSIVWGVKWISTSESQIENQMNSELEITKVETELEIDNLDSVNSALIEKLIEPIEPVESIKEQSNNNTQSKKDLTLANQNSIQSDVENAPDLEKDILSSDPLLNKDQILEMFESKSWSNDFYLESLIIKHLKVGVTTQELAFIFEQRFQKDISNAVILQPNLSYFFENEALHEEYDHFSYINYSASELLAQFPQSQLNDIDLNKERDVFFNGMFNSTGEIELIHHAFWLNFFINSENAFITLYSKTVIAQLVDHTLGSQNPKIRNLAQTFERYLQSKESLINWILQGGDKYSLFVNCECLIKSAISMNLTQSQWAILLNYLLEHSPQYVFQVVSRLNNAQLNIDFKSIWLQLEKDEPQLQSFDPFSRKLDQNALNSYSNEQKQIIQTLWKDYFLDGERFIEWEKNQLQTNTQSEINQVLASITWLDILNIPEIVFNRMNVNEYLVSQSQLTQLLIARGLKPKLSAIDFWFIPQLNELMVSLFQNPFFDVVAVKDEVDMVMDELPIAVRLNELQFDIVMLVFSQDSYISSSQMLFGVENETFYHWPRYIQSNYMMLEFIYRLKNEELNWQNQTTLNLTSSEFSELASILNAYCVVEQFYRNFTKTEEVHEAFYHCQQKGFQFFFESNQLNQGTIYDDKINKHKNVLDNLDVESLFEVWESGKFTFDWIQKVS